MGGMWNTGYNKLGIKMVMFSYSHNAEIFLLGSINAHKQNLFN